MGKFRQSSATKTHIWCGKHRFEHWYRDNTIYFITSKARDGNHVFRSTKAQEIFWDRFTHWSKANGFHPIITTLMSNHYHTVGYLEVGEKLGVMMQKVHGSVAKLVNDTLPNRHLPFWRTRGNRDYFDGCLRTPKQLDRTYRYVQTQAIRAGLMPSGDHYGNTRVGLTLTDALRFADTRNAYLPTVPYARYGR